MTTKPKTIGDMNYGRFKVHPLLDAFPLMNDEELNELTADIAEAGLQEPIVLAPDDETIVDGRNRYLACVRSGMDPSYRTLGPHYNETEIIKFIISANVRRQSLSVWQRASIRSSIEDALVGLGHEREWRWTPAGVHSPPAQPCEICGAPCVVTVDGWYVHPPCARGWAEQKEGQ